MHSASSQRTLKTAECHKADVVSFVEKGAIDLVMAARKGLFSVCKDLQRI